MVKKLLCKIFGHRKVFGVTYKMVLEKPDLPWKYIENEFQWKIGNFEHCQRCNFYNESFTV